LRATDKIASDRILAAAPKGSVLETSFFAGKLGTLPVFNGQKDIALLMSDKRPEMR